MYSTLDGITSRKIRRKRRRTMSTRESNVGRFGENNDDFFEYKCYLSVKGLKKPELILRFNKVYGITKSGKVVLPDESYSDVKEEIFGYTRVELSKSMHDAPYAVG